MCALPIKNLPVYASRFVIVLSLLTTSLMFAVGCTSKGERVALKKIADIFQANVSTKVGYISTTEKNKQSGKYLHLTVRNPAYMNATNHGDLSFPAAKCAYEIYKSDILREDKRYDFIRVTFAIDKEQHTVELPYNTIKRYHEQHLRDRKLLVSLCTKTFHHEYFNGQQISPAAAQQLYDRLHGANPDSLVLLGFREGQSGKTEVLLTKFMIRHHKYWQPLTLVTDFNRANAPILGFSLGQPVEE